MGKGAEYLVHAFRVGSRAIGGMKGGIGILVSDLVILVILFNGF